MTWTHTFGCYVVVGLYVNLCMTPWKEVGRRLCSHHFWTVPITFTLHTLYIVTLWPLLLAAVLSQFIEDEVESALIHNRLVKQIAASIKESEAQIKLEEMKDVIDNALEKPKPQQEEQPTSDWRATQTNGWIAIAEQNQRNADYYRGLVIQIGEMLGKAAYTDDVGMVHDDVLCAKVPELVQAALKPADVI